MSPKTFPSLIALLAVRPQIGYTLRRVRANAYTQALVPVFEALLDGCAVIQQKEFEIDDEVDDTIVQAAAVDSELNPFAQLTSDALLAITRRNREDELYLHYFHGKQLHVFIRPQLGEKLGDMKKWIPSLNNSEHPSLQALGVQLPALIEKAENAVTAREAAEQKRSEFRLVGERKKFIDKVNATRKEAYGFLATLPHKYPGLPSNFAAGFFMRDRTKDNAPPTLEDVEAKVAALAEQLAVNVKLRDQMKEAQEEAAEKAAKEAEAHNIAQAKLEVIQKELAEKQKEAAALMAILQPDE